MSTRTNYSVPIAPFPELLRAIDLGYFPPNTPPVELRRPKIPLPGQPLQPLVHSLVLSLLFTAFEGDTTLLCNAR
jgi:hypothetical protein